METIKVKVCIIGGGSAGMGAAYALRGLRDDLVIVEKYNNLGGTAVNAWVETWINGINLPYILDVLDTLISKGYITAEDVDNSWVGKQFAKNKSCKESIYIPREILAEKYAADMSDSHVRILNNCLFLNAITEESGGGRKKVSSITVRQEDRQVCIYADFFIDSSGSGVLCRSVNGKAGKDFLFGEDGKDRFQEDMAPINPNETIMNEPSLFYMVGKGTEEYRNVKELGRHIQYSITADGYIDDYYGWKSPGWLNPMTGLGGTGKEALDDEDGLYRRLSEKAQFQHWALVKEEMKNNTDKNTWKGYCPKRQKDYVHLGKWAPMLGIRESYRIVCERMLTQKDLTIRIQSQDLKDYIACGSHGVDMHVNGNIDRGQINKFNNALLQPGGIPFDCIRPKHLSNVLIACKAFGASHIALACRRTNKEMAQLGWAAGHATAICLNNSYDNYAKIGETNGILQELQSRIGLKESVKKMEGLM